MTKPTLSESCGPPEAPESHVRPFPLCRSLLGEDRWVELEAACARDFGGLTLSRAIPRLGSRLGLPEFLAELVSLEETLGALRSARSPLPVPAQRTANPSLVAREVRWRGLADLLQGSPAAAPRPGDAVVLAWRTPGEGGERLREATPADLLALKIVAEELDVRRVAQETGVSPGDLEDLLRGAEAQGLILAPPSGLRRDPGAFPRGEERFLTAATFTLQWHVTQACDLRCAHCYDRSERAPLGLDQGLRVLDELFDFCRERHVSGQVTFSGGNPLLHPDFLRLYGGAWERGFVAGILGNPAPRQRIEELVAVARPDFFQVSLEGLEEHNDRIRGPGHFERTLEFLDALGDLGVYSMVMLTLTRENMDQVLPLGEVLRGRTGVLHFNRLSPVGEGARLALPEPGAYADFLEAYLEAAARNPVLGIKDNLFNPLLRARGRAPFGGCTGHGCGAAFNFLSLLADGEVHACRKFPSPVGDVREQALGAIYDSPRAAQYRAGCLECRECDLRAACGGCLASASGQGLDPFSRRDPFCSRDPVSPQPFPPARLDPGFALQRVHPHDPGENPAALAPGRSSG
ncbi:MAG: thio(seleno)oxazole modification radical SAM maturase SbtM [Thermodesulfobacteriota bacterium]